MMMATPVLTIFQHAATTATTTTTTTGPPKQQLRDDVRLRKRERQR